MMKRDVYTGYLKLYGEEDRETLREAGNYASLLIELKRFKEAEALLRKLIPVAQRVLGDNNMETLRMEWIYAEALYKDASASLDDLREAVTTLEDTAPTARRVLGSAHPDATGIEGALRTARAALRARETPPQSA